MFLEILAIFFSTVIVWTVIIELNKKLNNRPPGPISLPYFGGFLQLIPYKNIPPYIGFKEVSKGNLVTGLQLGNVYSVIVNDYENIKNILCSEAWIDRFYDAYMAERSFQKHLGIIFIGGPNHKEMRRFTVRVLRDFGFGVKKSMESVLSEEINDLFHILDAKAKESNGVVCMRQFFTLSVMNILWSMVAGVRFGHDDPKLTKLIGLIDQMSKANPIGGNTVMIFPILRHIYKFTSKGSQRRAFIQELHTYFKAILKERRELGLYKEEQRDFFDVFLREIDNHKEDDPETNYYTDEQFIMVTFDLFVAGAETTSNTLEFALLYMILNPHVQKKVQEEIDSVVGNRQPSLLDRPNMPYTEATILEIQRMANVLPMVVRGSTQDTTVGSYNIPKGAIAILNTYQMHNDVNTWGDPEIFRPERFLNEKREVINAHKILPFGAGKRVCLGEVLAKASLFSYFTSLLQRYKFEQSPTHPASYTHVLGFTLSPEAYYVVPKLR